jgi:hypothetical protein
LPDLTWIESDGNEADRHAEARAGRRVQEQAIQQNITTLRRVNEPASPSR